VVDGVKEVLQELRTFLHSFHPPPHPLLPSLPPSPSFLPGEKGGNKTQRGEEGKDRQFRGWWCKRGVGRALASNKRTKTNGTPPHPHHCLSEEEQEGEEGEEEETVVEVMEEEEAEAGRGTGEREREGRE
jgi:hypothetical protein